MPEGLTQLQVPFKELFPTLEAFVRDYMEFGYDEEYGAYGWYANPNAKWDWYSIGGRWIGHFTAKAGTPEEYLITGRPRVFGADGEEYIRPAGRIGCDGCRKSDLDFAFAREERVQSFEKRWKAMTEAGQENDDLQRRYQYCFEMGTTYEEEKQKAESCHPFGTFAILKDGVWYEQGEMGWFACVISDIFLTQPAVFRINVADRALPREILALLGLLHPIGEGFR